MPLPTPTLTERSRYADPGPPSETLRAGLAAMGPGGWRFRAVIVSVVLASLGYLGLSLWGGWDSVRSAVAHVGIAGTAIAVLLSLLNYGLRFLRWQLYLHALGHRIPWKPSLRIYLAGFALTTTPGKAGEALRSVLLKPWGVPYPRSFAAFLSERLSDLLAVVLLTLFGLTLYPAARPLIIVGGLLVAVGLTLLSQARGVAWMERTTRHRPGRVGGALRHLAQVLREAHACHRPGLLIQATLLGLAGWTAEAVAFHLILGWMGVDASLTFAIFVFAVGTLAGALTFLPGGLGGAEAAMVALLVWKGMPTPDAVAATVLIRLTTLWFAVGLGIGALIPGTGRGAHADGAR